MRCRSALSAFVVSSANAGHFVGLTAVLALIVAACSAPATSPIALTMARARWAENAPTAYSVTIHRSCECLPEMSGPVVVVVRNKIVESRRYVRSSAAVAPTYDELFPTIDGLFAIIDAAVRDGTRPLDVRYDPTRGYPTRIALGDPALDNPVYSVSELRPQ